MASLCAKSTSYVKGSAVRGAAMRPRIAGRRAVKVNAKYGEEGKYFDLQDLPNTTGSWDMYGVDETKRYPALQEQFFAQSADIISRRDSLRAFVALAGIGAIATFGLKGAADAKLPITTGPREGQTENGKGGKRARL